MFHQHTLLDIGALAHAASFKRGFQCCCVQHVVLFCMCGRLRRSQGCLEVFQHHPEGLEHVIRLFNAVEQHVSVAAVSGMRDRVIGLDVISCMLSACPDACGHVVGGAWAWACS